MSRKLQPFRRSDGVLELAVIGNLGLANAYNSSKKVTHYVENEQDGRETVDPDSYYVQIEDGDISEYTSKGVHLLRNIEIGENVAMYEHFAVSNDSSDQDDWIEEKCPAQDFPSLLNSGKLIPMRNPMERP